MDNTKVVTILNKIIEISRLKKIDWEKNRGSSNSFKALFADNTFYINKQSNDFTFFIINSSGDEVGRISEVVYYLKLQDLFDLARRKALNIDEELDEINKLLDSIK